MNRLRTFAATAPTTLVLALVLAACGGSATPTPEAVKATPAPGAQVITITSSEDGEKYSFNPSALTLKPGQQVVVRLVNAAGSTKSHGFQLKAADGTDIVKSEVVKAGASLDIPFTVPAAGKYQFLCFQRGHADRGQTGTLTSSAS